MKFSYSYKTSDGVRHEGRVDAPSREDAFVELRRKGIKAIKVVSLSGSKANGEETVITRKAFVFAALLLGLFSGVAAAIWIGRADLRSRRVKAIEREANAIVERHRMAVATLHLDELRDYAAIAAAKAPGFLNQKISLCYHDLDTARTEIRELFRRPLLDFSERPQELGELKRIYADAMDSVDLIESRFAKDEKAYRLLDTNRGEWTFNGTTVVFTNPRLETHFANLTREIEQK